MTSFAVEITGMIVGEDDTVAATGQLDELTDKILDELTELGAIDPDVTVGLTTGEIHFYLVVDTPTPKDAFEKAESLVHKAIDASGVHIPPNRKQLELEELDWRIRRSDRLVEA